MLRADFLVTRFSGPIRKALLVFGYLLGASFFLMVITGGWEESVRAWVDLNYEGEGVEMYMRRKEDTSKVINEVGGEQLDIDFIKRLTLVAKITFCACT